ncbi:MAG: serine protease [Pseudomonadota bacterium]
MGTLFAAAPAQADRELVRTIARVKPSVVGVGTFQAIRQPRSLLKGTGFVVGVGLHVLTNFHVIDQNLTPVNREFLAVLVGRGSRFESRTVEVVATAPDYDLALLKMKGTPLPALTLSTVEQMRPEGTSVAITGFPIGPVLGLFPVTHTGIIAAISPNVIPQRQARLLDAEMILRKRFLVYQLDLVAYPGNSGSPLFNTETGEVVGVLNSTFVKGTKEKALTDPSGISFAIPAKHGLQLLKQARVKVNASSASLR